MMPRRYLGWCVVAFLGVTFLLCVLLDYAITSYVMVTLGEATRAEIWYNSIDRPMIGFVKYCGLGMLMASYGVISFGVVSFGDYALFVSAYYLMRRRLVETFMLVAPAVLFVFEMGLLAFDPFEIHNHVANFLVPLGLSFITNERVVYVSFVMLMAGSCVTVVRRLTVKSMVNRE